MCCYITESWVQLPRIELRLMSASDTMFLPDLGTQRAQLLWHARPNACSFGRLPHVLLSQLSHRFDERGCHQTAGQLRNAEACPAEEIAVCTEKSVEGDWLDIFVRFSQCFAVSIENKTRTELGKGQLLRYDRHLKGRAVPFVQVFLAPSNYPPLRMLSACPQV
jgi:hypothetical protein